MNKESILLTDICDFISQKISPLEIDKESYISTENMLSDLGGVVAPANVPNTGKVNSYQKGDILFSNIRTYFRKVWLANRDGGCSNDLIVFRPKENVSPEYLFCVLADPSFIEYTVKTSKGTKMPRGDKDAIKQYQLIKSDKNQRDRIGVILQNYNDKIELNRKMNQTLEEMAQALFKSWFVDFDPVLDNAFAAGNTIPEALQVKAKKRKLVREKADCPSLTKEMQELFPSSFVFNEELEKWIPVGWIATPVEDALIINPKVSIKKGETAKFADMKALPTAGYSVDSVIEKEFKGGAKFNQGDVLLARITPCLQNGKTAIVDFLENEESGFGSTEFIVLRGKEELKTSFVACLARFDAFVNHCIQNMVGSSGRQRVMNSCFSSYYLVLPPDNILKKFDELTMSHFSKITSNSRDSQTLTKLRDTLLPQLISGKLRVTEAMMEVEKQINN
jgi:type I restriction enzyme S subunit